MCQPGPVLSVLAVCSVSKSKKSHHKSHEPVMSANCRRSSRAPTTSRPPRIERKRSGSSRRADTRCTTCGHTMGSTLLQCAINKSRENAVPAVFSRSTRRFGARPQSMGGLAQHAHAYEALNWKLRTRGSLWQPFRKRHRKRQTSGPSVGPPPNWPQGQIKTARSYFAFHQF